MKRKQTLTRVDESFMGLINRFQKDTEQTLGKKPSSKEVTRYISSFLIEEDLYPWTVKSVKRSNKKRGGWL